MTPKLICVGDSITAGQYVEAGEGWTHQLPAEISRFVCPFGSSGRTTRIALEHFPAVQEAIREGDVVALQFGFNDANRWDSDKGLPRVSRQAFRWNLVEMASRAWRFGASDVFFLTTFKTERPGRYNKDLESYDDEMFEAASVSLATVIDIWRELPDGLLQADGLHLTAKGHRKYARIASPIIEHALLAVC